MKKNRLILIAAAALVLTAMLAGCKKDTNPSQKTYTVTFDSNGGSAVDPKVISKGDTLSEPASPIKPGFNFAGWFTDNDTSASRVIFPYTVIFNITLYAKWTPVVYTVTFDSNGGSAVDPQDVANGSEAVEPAAPTKAGYTFTGWFTDNGTFADRWDFATRPVTSDTTLYAQWAAVTYTVTFDSNSGSAVDPQIVNEGNTLSEPEIPIKDGYTFAGWYIDNGTFANSVTFPYTVISDVTFYAKWLESTWWIAVRTPADLDAVRNNLSGKYVLMNDISLADYNASAGWVPIGDDVTPFTGKFNGNEHKITGVTFISFAPIITTYSGLFGYIAGGSVSDLGVVTEIAGAGLPGLRRYVGAIAGYVDNSAITNCCSTGDIYAHTNVKGSGGGIAGYVNNSTIANCYSTGNITVSTSTSGVLPVTYSGGIVGYAAGSSTVINCYSRGNISGYYSGGIAGAVDGSTVTGCAAINPAIYCQFPLSGYGGSGRMAGYINNVVTISNNFALIGMTVTGDTSMADSGVDKTDDDFKDQSTYSAAVNGDGLGGLGWRFGNDDANPWKMPAGGGYPILYWQN